jgi:hypothetical protein
MLNIKQENKNRKEWLNLISFDEFCELFEK